MTTARNIPLERVIEIIDEDMRMYHKLSVNKDLKIESRNHFRFTELALKRLKCRIKYESGFNEALDKARDKEVKDVA